jgi:tetratricopeptide (TPR) repeat protein
MFLSKFFKKDHSHYLTQAGKHLAAERYADARVDFQEALKRCPADAAQDCAQIRQGLDRAGNGLGELNLHEAERSYTAGELQKALDHFELAAELAVDETLRSRALAGIEKLQQESPAPQAAPSVQKSHGGSSCASCKDSGSHGTAQEEPTDAHLSDEDRFFLMVQPLPGELAARYAGLGEKFRQAYLLIHDGDDAKALPILQQMLVSDENDIVIYEVALIMYRSQRLHECETLLQRSLAINASNSASYLALVHLQAESGRFPEAIANVERMMELGILSDQTQFMLGELYEAAGDEALAFDAWSKSLEFPAVARSAAERLVPLLAAQGRSEEANYLIKRYLKGCC